MNRRELFAAGAEHKTRLKLRLLEWHALTEDPLDQTCRRALLGQYDAWSPRAMQPGRDSGPDWMKMRFAKAAKPV